MHNETNKSEFASQAELAIALGVDRTTIGLWTKKGLPYIKADQGKPHTFHIGCCMWWMLGKEFAERRNVSGLSPAQQIIFARAVADEIDPGDDMAGEQWMVPLLAEIGMSESDVVRDVAHIKGLMRGLQCKRQRRKKTQKK